MKLKIHPFLTIAFTLCCVSGFHLMCKAPQQAVDASGLVLHAVADTLEQVGLEDTTAISDADYFEKEYVRMENHI